MKRLGILVSVVMLLAFVLSLTSSHSQSYQERAQTDQNLEKTRELKQKKKRAPEDAIKKLETNPQSLMEYSVEELLLVTRIKVMRKFSGSKIYAADEKRTFLGTIATGYDGQSIFNDYSEFGNEFNSESIWNDYGKYGGEYSQYSPFNPYASDSPIIIKSKTIIGRLTVNDYEQGAVDPYLLKYCFK